MIDNNAQDTYCRVHYSEHHPLQVRPCPLAMCTPQAKAMLDDKGPYSDIQKTKLIFHDEQLICTSTHP